MSSNNNEIAIEKYKKSCVEAIGGKESEYQNNIKFLTEKWSKATQSTAKELVGPVLSQTTPMNYAIIVDNDTYFKLHYADEKEKMNSNAALAIACLCGAEKIATFLLEQLNLTYSSAGHDYILRYAAESMNTKWAQKIAKEMSQSMQDVPAEISASNNIVNDMIWYILNKDNQRQKSSFFTRK